VSTPTQRSQPPWKFGGRVLRRLFARYRALAMRTQLLVAIAMFAVAIGVVVALTRGSGAPAGLTQSFQYAAEDWVGDNASNLNDAYQGAGGSDELFDFAVDDVRCGKPDLEVTHGGNWECDFTRTQLGGEDDGARENMSFEILLSGRCWKVTYAYDKDALGTDVPMRGRCIGAG
jgi:hypothetical protein